MKILIAISVLLVGTAAQGEIRAGEKIICDAYVAFFDGTIKPWPEQKVTCDFVLQNEATDDPTTTDELLAQCGDSEFEKVSYSFEARTGGSEYKDIVRFEFSVSRVEDTSVIVATPDELRRGRGILVYGPVVTHKNSQALFLKCKIKS